MKLSELDLELLELVALESPWLTVRDEFAARYGSLAAVAHRVVELEHAELLTFRAAVGGRGTPSASALAADADLDAGVDHVDAIGTARWFLVATERGFAVVEERLGKE